MPSPPTPSPFEPVFPRRSAHASIRGYLYQACLGVVRWLELGEGEVLVCEGDEDLDRRLLEEGLGTVEQVKDLSRPVGDTVLRESLQRFLVTRHALHLRGQEGRRFLFTTTAERPGSARRVREGDPLAFWHDPPDPPAAARAVRAWLAPEDGEEASPLGRAIAWVDGNAGGWVELCQSVEWRFGAPSLDSVRAEIGQALRTRPDSGSLPLDDALLVDWLVSRVLEASRQKRAADRVLTREGLAGLLAGVGRQLARWVKSQQGRTFVQAFNELVTLERLLEPGTRELPAPHRDGGLPPSKLLTAAYQVVPFESEARAAELSALEAWCNGERPRTAWLWTGEGGSGKTRLAIELCHRLRAQGWEAGFLRSGTGEGELGALVTGAVPRLVVMDYAETQLERLRPLLARIGEGLTQPPRLRLLLLARRAEDWFPGLSAAGDAVEDVLLASPEPHPLPPLAADEASRADVYRRAARVFGERVEGKPAPEVVPTPAALTEERYDRALYLHMAALIEVLGDGGEGAGDILARILDHECRFWEKEIRDLRQRDGAVPAGLPRLLERALAALTLVGGATTESETVPLLSAVIEDLKRDERTALLELLRRLYAATTPGRHLEGLQPDLLGEELVARVLAADSSLLPSVLQAAPEPGKRQALTVLTRLAWRGRKEAEGWLDLAFQSDLDGLAELALEVAVETGDPIGKVLAGWVGKAGEELLRRVRNFCAAKANWKSAPLLEVTHAATEKALQLHSRIGGDGKREHLVERARLLTRLGSDLSNLGRREEALAATQEAVELTRQLYGERPDAFRAELAGSLNNLGADLSNLGRREEALATTQEAVELYRQLYGERPDAFRDDLAQSLNNLGLFLGNLGRREEALAAMQEAVELRRQLYEQSPDAFRADLGQSLNNLGNCLSNLGRREEALAATQEAVALYRQLYGERPDAFRADLAGSLNNLGLFLSNLGRREEALAATQEAVGLHRQLYGERPDAFRDDLALSLNNLGLWLSALNHPEEAHTASREAVELLGPLFLRLPAAYEEWMRSFVTNYRRHATAAAHPPDEDLLAPIEAELRALADRSGPRP